MLTNVVTVPRHASTRRTRYVWGGVLFSAAIVLLVVVVQRAARPLLAAPTTTPEIIARSFDLAVGRPYRCLVVGNSRIFRGINPDMFREPGFNFGHDQDAPNQMYYKLRYLERAGVTFDALVFGVDYFEFSTLLGTRNDAYGYYLGQEYLADYQRRASRTWRSAMRAFFHPVDEDAFNTFMIVHFTRPAGAVLESGLRRLTHEVAEPPRFVLRPNGQFLIDGDHQSGDRTFRDSTILPIQDRYFRLSLQWAHDHGVKTALIMPPTLERELQGYAPDTVRTMDRWFIDTAKGAGAVYLNYAGRREFTPEDFTDGTHLTERAADRFSRMVDGDLARLGIFR